ncbi:MAG: alpha/beta hydrolase, partial [Defluviitaleaceae bacterium]|nr:alpha/beta hydrolase [Defluviitaleaceae bacterium]
MTKILKLTGITFAGLVALVILAYVSVTMIYPAILRSVHRINVPNGIDSMEIVDIGGVSQALYFRGHDMDNPAILFIHGGPGAPEMPMLHSFQYALEPYFTIVHWDQRNAGKTF